MSYPTIAQVRTLEPDVADAVKYPDGVLQARLDEAIDDIEMVCERRFVPKDVTEVHELGDEGVVRLREGSAEHRAGAEHGVVSCTLQVPFAAVETVDLSLVAIVRGELAHAYGTWPSRGTVRVTYGTGLAACPTKIVAVVARLARLYALRPKSAQPDRAERFSFDQASGRTFVLAMPGVRAFGMPDLDASIARWSLHHGLTF